MGYAEIEIIVKNYLEKMEWTILYFKERKCSLVTAMILKRFCTVKQKLQIE